MLLCNVFKEIEPDTYQCLRVWTREIDLGATGNRHNFIDATGKPLAAQKCKP